MLSWVSYGLSISAFQVCHLLHPALRSRALQGLALPLGLFKFLPWDLSLSPKMSNTMQIQGHSYLVHPNSSAPTLHHLCLMNKLEARSSGFIIEKGRACDREWNTRIKGVICGVRALFITQLLSVILDKLIFPLISKIELNVILMMDFSENEIYTRIKIS